MRRSAASILAGVVVALLPATGAVAQSSADRLAATFDAPPAEARPRVWWHWVNGNVSEDGIRRDLAWMHRVGVGGFTLFDAAFRSPPTPVVVEDPVIFHSPEWSRAVAVTAEEAARLGLDFGVHIAGGWSESGGPWVQPQQAMKKLVWSETRVEGGRAVGRLAAPPNASGVFMDYPIARDLAEPRLYADVAVIAFPAPQEEAAPSVRVATSGGEIQAGLLGDGRFDEEAVLTAGPDGAARLTLVYDRPWTVRSLTLSTSSALPNGVVEVSQDGVAFRPLVTLPGPAEKALPVRTYAFPEVTARAVRLTVPSPAQGRIGLREFAPRGVASIDRFEEKSGLGTLSDYGAVATPEAPSAGVVDPATVVDLTFRLAADGTLNWTPPPGRWIVQRFGYSLTGKRNGPATPAATGLEADKLNADHVRSHLHGFFDPLMAAVGENHGERGLTHAIVDSWEAGQQNWTEAMPAEFERRRGYVLSPWLPVMTGRVVGSADQSDRFLWDFRLTIGDLLADNHYAVVRDFVHERGLYLYGEAMGVDLPTVGDGLRLKGLSDVPTGEFWAQMPGQEPWAQHVADIREAASAAHIYGKSIVAAEAFTALDAIPAWSMGPRELKPVADRFMAEGVNRFVIHTSAHQPFEDRAPGITLRRYGQHFTRHEAWADLAGGWLDYLARSSTLLQQGTTVADVAFFVGEGAPAAAPFAEGLRPEAPAGHDYDFVNTEVILDRMTVRDGRMELPGGASYRLLVLPKSSERMSAAFADKLERLVNDGAVVLGPRPEGAPGLTPDEDQQVRQVASRLWGDAPSGREGRRVGPGRVFSGVTPAQALAALGVARDLEWAGDADLTWTHRRLDGADIYFVSNQAGQAVQTEASFRVDGRVAEIWDARDGSRRPASWRRRDGATEVSLALEPDQAVFVVFAEPTTAAEGAAPAGETRRLLTLDGPWRVAFQPDRGAPSEVRLDQLESWTLSRLEGVRHFSGLATYRKTFSVPAVPGPVRLDLGDVREVAAVRINGTAVGQVWTAPFRLDVTHALRAGENTIEIDVANYWHNRLVGDAQPGASPVGFTTVTAYAADEPLRPSGLLGPVTLWATDPGEP